MEIRRICPKRRHVSLDDVRYIASEKGAMHIDVLRDTARMMAAELLKQRRFRGWRVVWTSDGQTDRGALVALGSARVQARIYRENRLADDVRIVRVYRKAK